MAWNKLSNYATTISTHEGKTRVVYHNTTIVSFDNHTITLDTSGWKTVTTKRKMNQASEQFGLNYHVFQIESDWFIRWENKTLPFEDGMILVR